MDSCRGPTGTVPTSRQARLRTLCPPDAHRQHPRSLPQAPGPAGELRRPQCDTAHARGFMVVNSSLGGGQ